MQNSKIISCAKVSLGSVHDNVFFKELVLTTIKNGFMIKRLIADRGYCGKDNYAFCQSLNIREIFIDFKKNSIAKRAKSSSWRKQLMMFRENPELWHETYRFRVIVEGIFSTIKRKQMNYLRSKKGISQDVELLLKCLCYNITIICKFS